MTPSRRAKIQKVLALAKDNPNAHEAAVALATAERLLKEEGLTLEAFQSPAVAPRAGRDVDWSAPPQGWGWWGAPPPRPRPTETLKGVTLTRRSNVISYFGGYKHVPPRFKITAYKLRNEAGSAWKVYVDLGPDSIHLGQTPSGATLFNFILWLDLLDWGKIKAEHPEVWPREEPRRTTLRADLP